MTNVAKKRFPFLPVAQLLKYRFPTNTFINKTNCPVVIFHGTDDSVVPYSSVKKLSETLPQARVDVITIPEGGHNNLIEFQQYKDSIEEMLQ